MTQSGRMTCGCRRRRSCEGAALERVGSREELGMGRHDLMTWRNPDHPIRIRRLQLAGRLGFREFGAKFDRSEVFPGGWLQFCG